MKNKIHHEGFFLNPSKVEEAYQILGKIDHLLISVRHMKNMQGELSFSCPVKLYIEETVAF